MREPLSANGTETQTDWNAINWRKANRTVRNLRYRIFRATQEGNLKHEYLLRAIGPVPGRERIKQWLKAGYIEQEVFHATERGTPQGGVVTPPTMWQTLGMLF